MAETTKPVITSAPEPEPVSYMETVINKELLLFAVQRNIQCKVCRNVLDVSRAVNVEVENNGVLAGEFTVCVGCYDEMTAKLAELPASYKLTVLDGRVLYPSKKRKTKV